MLLATENPIPSVLIGAAALLAVVIVAIEVRDWRRRQKAKARGGDSLVSEPKPLTKAEAQARSARREGTKKQTKRSTGVVADLSAKQEGPVVIASAAPKAKAKAVAAESQKPKPVAVKAPVVATAPSGVQGAIVPKAFLKAKETPVGDPSVQDVTLVRDVAVSPRASSEGQISDRVADPYDFAQSARSWKPASARNHSSQPAFVDVPIVQAAAQPAIIGQGDESEEELEVLREKFEEDSRKLERSAVDAALARRSARTAAVDSSADNSGDSVIPEIRANARALSRRQPAPVTGPATAADLASTSRMAAAIAASVAKVSAPAPNTALTPMPPPLSSARRPSTAVTRAPEPSPFDEPQGAEALVAAAMAGAPGLDEDEAIEESCGTDTWMAKVSSSRKVVAEEVSEVAEPVVAFHADVSSVDTSSRIRMVALEIAEEPESEAAPAVQDTREGFSDFIISDSRMVGGDETEASSELENFDLIQVGRASAQLRRVQAEESARQSAAAAEQHEDSFEMQRQPLRIVRDSSSVRIESEETPTVISDGMIPAFEDAEPMRASDSMITMAVDDPALVDGVASSDELAESVEEEEIAEITAPRARSLRTRIDVANSVAGKILSGNGSGFGASFSSDRMSDRMARVDASTSVPTSQRIDIADQPMIQDEIVGDETPVNMSSRPDDEREVDIYMDINSESMRAPMVELEPSMIEDIKVVVPPDLLEPGMGESDDEQAAMSGRRGRRRGSRSQME